MYVCAQLFPPTPDMTICICVCVQPLVLTSTSLHCIPIVPSSLATGLQQVGRLDADVSWVRALDGSEYMPGLVGLNNLKASDYANVVLQLLARVTPLRCV
jgi:hypothetical protein